jgi:hypothetical protein
MDTRPPRGPEPTSRGRLACSLCQYSLEARAHLDKDKMWTILAWTVVLHTDTDPLPVAGWRDHVLEARTLGLHAVARAPRTQVVAQRLALARHAHLVA